MKKPLLALIVLLAACDLQPAPKQAPPPAPVPVQAEPPAGSPAPVPTMPHPIPAPVPAIQPTAECQQAAIKVAELLIKDAEPSQKPEMERERVDIVRNTELACTKMGWTSPALACIAQSKTSQDTHACLAKFPPPGAGSAAAGSGSGAPPIARPHGRPKTPS
jgi:hypothetical protein